MIHDAEPAIIDAFYRGVCDDDALHQAIGMVAAHFDSPSACLGESDQGRGCWVIGSGTVDSGQLARYAEAVAFDPAPRAFSTLRMCSASTSDRVFSDRQRRRSVFINEYMRPAGLDHSLGSPLYLDARRYALIGVHQALHRKRFCDEDIASLERLSPHVARTLELRHAFLDLRRKEATYEALVDRRDTGMVGIRAGRPLFANRAAQAAAAAGDGLALDRIGRPIVGDRAARVRLARLEADVIESGAGGFVRVTRPSGAPPYIVLVSRLPGLDEEFGAEIGVLFSIHDPCHRSVPPEQVIAGLLHIPLGPAKVVRALLQGDDLRTYAERASLSLSTVRFHLKNAFARTETHSQAELVRLAISASSAFPPPRRGRDSATVLSEAGVRRRSLHHPCHSGASRRREPGTQCRKADRPSALQFFKNPPTTPTISTMPSTKR